MENTVIDGALEKGQTQVLTFPHLSFALMPANNPADLANNHL